MGRGLWVVSFRVHSHLIRYASHQIYHNTFNLVFLLLLSDVHMICETKISSGYSTIVPADIRKSLGINADDILEWTLGDHEIVVKPRKKMQFDDIVGLIEEGGDALSAKKRIQSGV